MPHGPTPEPLPAPIGDPLPSLPDPKPPPIEEPKVPPRDPVSSGAARGQAGPRVAGEALTPTHSETLVAASISDHRGELRHFAVKDRFDFEDRILPTVVPPRPATGYRDPHPSPTGIRVAPHPNGHGFEAGPYLEFDKHTHEGTHFHVMQEGRPTGFRVVLD